MKTRISVCLLMVMVLLAACKRLNRDPYSDTPTTGRISIGVDETFKPIAEAELMVFEELYRYSEVTPLYKPESQCFNLLMNDSVRLVIASRKLSQQEKDALWLKKILAREVHLATDAIALIVNPLNPDTILSISQLEGMLTGSITEWSQISPASLPGRINLVFDHQQSSIVRYAADSIGRGKPLKGQLYALDSNLDVVDYVSRNATAIGLIGVSWISDSDDSTQLSFLRKVRAVALSQSDKATPANSFKPYQAYIFDGSYPLTRKVYGIDTEPRNGLATGVLSFLASDKGQRIILKSGILPATAPVRLVNVRDNF